MLGDDQRPWFRQIEYLPGDVAARRRRGQRFAAPSAGLWIMVDGGIGLCDLAKCLARMAPLTAGLLAGRFAQTADLGGFFSPSLDGGLPLLLLFNPRRRSNSAMRASCASSSAMSWSFENWLSASRSTDSFESARRSHVNQNFTPALS